MADFTVLRDCLKPKLLISGERDTLVPRERFADFCRTLAEPKQCTVVAGADHFWWGCESVLADTVVAFFREMLK